jgi:hypothetical protein
MSSIQEQLVAYLAPTVNIHPLVAPQGTLLPYVTYQRVANTVNNVLTGPPSIDNVRMQIDVWASTYAEAQSLAKSLITAMQAWTVQNFLINEYDLYEQEVQVFRVLIEYSIWQ